MGVEPETIDRRRVLRGPAAQYLLYEGREALCEGPTRTGKSWGLLLKLDYTAVNYPGSRQLVARQTRKSLSESILKDWRDEILWQGHPAISRTASRDHQDLYVYPNGSEIFFTGLDTMQDTASPILSSKWDRIYIIQAEETKESAWETLATRLSSFKTPYHQMTADCNPAAPSHWLNKRFNLQSKLGRQRFRFRHWDNPFFYDGLYPNGEWTREGREYVDTLEATLTGVRYKRFYLGQWAAADGLILDNWDPEKHVVEGSVEIDERLGSFVHLKGIDQPIRIAYFTAGVDWGWHPDPGCMSLWGYDAPRWHSKIRRFRVAEVVKTRWMMDEWADLAAEWFGKYHVRHFSCDRGRPENMRYIQSRLSKTHGKGVPVSVVGCPPIGGGHRQERDKSAQIDLMREGLGAKDGHQRTYLLKDAFPYGLDEDLRRTGQAACYEEEVESWTFLRPKGADREEPIPDDKCADHALDAARYDETLNFARGFGRDLDASDNTKKGQFDDEWARIKRDKKREREKRR